MRMTAFINSTTVRNAVALAMLRASNRIGGQFAPEATARRAARLFCTPMPGGRVRARDADDGGALSRNIEVGGRRVAVYQWGDVQVQPRVLLAHGWSSYVLRMLPWVHALRQAGFAVIGFDQPGHGRSDEGRCTLACFARTLHAVADRFGPLEGIVAHSMGGTAAMVALADGVVARRVVLISPAADPDAATSRFAQKTGLVSGIVPRILHCIEAQTGVGVRELTAHVRLPVLGMPGLVIHDFADPECHGKRAKATRTTGRPPAFSAPPDWGITASSTMRPPSTPGCVSCAGKRSVSAWCRRKTCHSGSGKATGSTGVA